MSFQPVSFINGANIYEVNLRQYTPEGTIKAFVPHLPRLQAMGVDILWFMPITPISLKNRKGSLGSYYAASDFESINPEYGDKNDFKNLVLEAHRLGLKVMIDWVTNHTGWDHTWTQQHPEYYIKNEHGSFIERNGWEDVIDLDYSREDMRHAMIESMAFWVRNFDLDGFRCDMAMLVPVDFWIEARIALDKIKQLLWLGECEDPNYFQAFDIQYAWEWMHLTRAVAQNQTNKEALRHMLHAYGDRKQFPKRYLYFTSNHDENSWNGTEFERYGSLHQIFAAISILLCDGIPLIYSGQELPLYHRLRFFDKDLIPWGTEVSGLHSFYAALLNLRKENKWYHLSHQYRCQVNTITQDSRIFSLSIGEHGDEDIIAVFNLTADLVHFKLENITFAGVYQNVFTGYEQMISSQTNAILNAYEYRIYKRKQP
jgi:glycosidase